VNFRAALFGVGQWAHEGWLQTLLDAAEKERIELYVVDLPQTSPPALRDDPRAGLATYVSWEDRARIGPLDLAVVAVPAKAHQDVIRSIASVLGLNRWLICEKPAGDSLLDFCSIWSFCGRLGWRFAVSDHYVVRPAVQALLCGEDRGDPSVADVSRVFAYMLETKETGPAQDAELDMLVHPVNLLHLFFPGSAFVPRRAFLARAAENPHANVTYVLTDGHLASAAGAIPCQIEVGKQLPADRKEILIQTREGTVEIDLSPAPSWRYATLVKKILEEDPAPEALADCGALAGSLMLRTWVSLASVQHLGKWLFPYAKGEYPELGGYGRLGGETGVNPSRHTPASARRTRRDAGA